MYCAWLQICKRITDGYPGKSLASAISTSVTSVALQFIVKAFIGQRLLHSRSIHVLLVMIPSPIIHRLNGTRIKLCIRLNYHTYNVERYWLWSLASLVRINTLSTVHASDILVSSLRKISLLLAVLSVICPCIYPFRLRLSAHPFLTTFYSVIRELLLLYTKL